MHEPGSPCLAGFHLVSLVKMRCMTAWIQTLNLCSTFFADLFDFDRANTTPYTIVKTPPTIHMYLRMHKK